jgi:hypothetical protein
MLQILFNQFIKIGLFEDAVGTSLRIEAANTIANHRTCELSHVIMRGGWDFSGICKVRNILFL